MCSSLPLALACSVYCRQGFMHALLHSHHQHVPLCCLAAAGRFQEGDTFYTTLRRDLSFQSDYDTAELQQQVGQAAGVQFFLR